jgi:uncharacterized protein
LVSAFIAPHGQIVQLLRHPLRDRYQLVLSMAILSETAETLLSKPSIRRYADYADDDVRAYIAWLLSVAELVEDDLPELRAVPDDPDDDLVVATAVVAKADYLVTGDREHLLPLGSYQGIQIITPRQLLELLGYEEQGRAA